MKFPAPRHNVPQPLSRFIGRQSEIAEARQLLSQSRLVTLTGAGGVGKTRLSYEVVAGVGDAFAEGVWVVELAALTDPALIPRAVATVLGVVEEAGRPLSASLTDALRDRHVLLVLDNCEHLLEACADLADQLLRACAGLSILATSREPLGMAGETIYRVPSLSLSRGIAAACSEAVTLFVERVRDSVPAFALTDRNTPAVETICHRLDGIPLAIELAAARVGMLSPEQIEARLDDRFRLLTGGSRTALPRYRTLRALIDWSHDLLGEREQTIFRRLAVFAGGWSLESAERVCADDGIAPEEILDLLSGLVGKSLVQADDLHGEVRYGFLESLREYAAERLRDADEEVTLRERHLAWCVSLAASAERELSGPRSVVWLDQLERERGNLRLALNWCIERGDAEPGLRLAGALARFWLVRGPYRETRAALAELLRLPAAQQQTPAILAVRPAALCSAGHLAMRQDDRAAGVAYFQEALGIFRDLDDWRGVGIALFSIGHVERVDGTYDRAVDRFAKALRLFESVDDRYWTAQSHLELGVIAYYRGDLTTAREHYEVSHALFTALGDVPGIAAAHNDLGEVALRRGDLTEAQTLLTAGLRMARQIDDKERVAMGLAALAGLAATQGLPARAVRLAAAATALNEGTGQLNSPAWHAMLAAWLEPAGRLLSAEAYAADHAAGRALPLDDAIEYALAAELPVAETFVDDDAAVVDAPTHESPAHHGSSSMVSLPRAPLTSDLTPRELEVAALVARGLTNRQIAAELVITEGTAANHVKHILARLVLDSRVQIAAWAIERGLHRDACSRSA